MLMHYFQSNSSLLSTFDAYNQHIAKNPHHIFLGKLKHKTVFHQNCDDWKWQIQHLFKKLIPVCSLLCIFSTNMWKSMRFSLKIANFRPEKWWICISTFYQKYVIFEEKLRNTRNTQKEQKIKEKYESICKKPKYELCFNTMTHETFRPKNWSHWLNGKTENHGRHLNTTLKWGCRDFFKFHSSLLW